MSKKNNATDEIKRAYDDYSVEMNKLEDEQKKIIEEYVSKLEERKKVQSKTSIKINN